MSLTIIHRPQAALTGRIYRVLLHRRADAAPLDWFADVLDTTETELRRAAASAPHLGVGPDSLLYCLPPQPMAAGFEVGRHDGRLLLRLPARGLRAPLLISGRYVGPAPAGDHPLGTGELAYTVHRLTLMARNWLPAVPDPTRHLFELIAEAWRHAGGARRFGAGFGIHRADFTEPIATSGTNRLELVTNRHHLVNLYPIPAEESR